MPRDCTTLPLTRDSGCTVQPLERVGSNTKFNMSDKATYGKVSEVLRRNLTPDSRNWIIACLDPYHDNQYEVEGLPDERNAPSIVQIHNQTYNLTAPDSAVANWDASIVFTGFNTPINWDSNSGGMITHNSSSYEPMTFNYDHSALSTGQPFGALDIWAGDTSSTWPTGAPGTIGDTNVSLGSVSTDSKCRLIAAGFEIINTTAEVYKQGSLTLANLPATSDDHFDVVYDDSAAESVWSDFPKQADKGIIRASTIDPLVSVPGSATWPASKGLYAIPRMVKIPVDTYSYDYSTDPLTFGTNSRIPVYRGTDGKVAVPEPTGYHLGGPGQPERKSPSGKPCAPNGFSPLQAYLTGLSHSTTLTIRFRTIVEYFPGLDSTLLPLANPSPIYDPRSIALYCAVASMAPYGVPVAQNAAGDYFRKILSILGTGLTLVAPLFGEFAPLAIAAGGLSKEASKAIPVKKNLAGPQAMQTSRRRRKTPISLKNL